MLAFGNLNQASSSPAATEHWKFISGSAGDIELNQPAGVTGIDSQLTFFGKVFRFIQGAAAGLPFVGQVLEATTTFVSAGVEDQGGGIGIISKLEYQDMATGAIHTHDVTQNGAHSEGNDGGAFVSTQRTYPTVIQDRARNLTTGDETRTEKTAVKHTNEVYYAGVKTVDEILEPTNWRIEDGASNKTFVVYRDGKLGVKYVAAALPLPVVANTYINIYDVDGNFIGKIPII